MNILFHIAIHDPVTACSPPRSGIETRPGLEYRLFRLWLEHFWDVMFQHAATYDCIEKASANNIM
jgi:hypothetical protein